MSEAEPIPPTSSVTALRIPMIKKGEYDLWSMKMRQYIAITDHILWDIITNGDQATTDPASSSAPKTSLAANARRNNEKALNILLSAIPDRHLLSFHDATNAKTLWTAIKARFGGNDASKKMQKNLLHNNSRLLYRDLEEELDSDTKGFRTSYCGHVVATMIRGQLDWDEIEFVISTTLEGLFKTKYCGTSQISQIGYNQAFALSKVQTAPNVLPTQMKILDAMEEIDMRWQVAYDNCKAKGKFMRRKSGSPIDSSQIMGDYLCISQRWNALTVKKLGSFCWECRFAKYQENRANGRQENMEFYAETSGTLWETDGLGDFDWSNKADDTPVSLALMATNSEARTEILGYQMSLESLEVILKTHEKNEYAWGDKYEQMEYDLKIRDLKLEEKQKELDQALKERDDFKGNPEEDLKDYAIIDSGCSGRGRISGKGTPRTSCIDLEESQLCGEISSIPLRLGHVNFKNINKLVKSNLVRGLPSKTFKLDPMFGIVEKGKQHRVLARRLRMNCQRTSRLLHMDLFGPVSVQGINNDEFCARKESMREYRIARIRSKMIIWVSLMASQKKAICWDTLLTAKVLESITGSQERKENYADSGGNVSTHDDVDDLDDQQFIVHGPNIHAAQNKPSEERTADKEVPLSSDEQALHDELVSLMHQESLAKLHNDAQRTAFEKEKKRIALEKGKECVDSTFTLSTANTPPQSTGNTPTDLMRIFRHMMVFFYKKHLLLLKITGH
ncbi:hypothetical protein Tco_1080264 [Tanacetum coccineum]|uniref:Uncharacterized protein n=1 Tax=Tanacetum coccineum TaxID=301880 RepID=A0ABQ5HUH8_9ASTR